MAFGVYEFAFGITKDHVTTATYPRRWMHGTRALCTYTRGLGKRVLLHESGMGGVVVSAPACSIIVASLYV